MNTTKNNTHIDLWPELEKNVIKEEEEVVFRMQG